jgi:hypothetical protein
MNVHRVDCRGGGGGGGGPPPPPRPAAPPPPRPHGPPYAYVFDNSSIAVKKYRRETVAVVFLAFCGGARSKTIFCY